MSDQARPQSPELPQQPGLSESTSQSDAPYDVQPAQSMGRQLAQRRQELGWTVEHVAGRLNLAPRQIDALESDNLTALPGLASTRGFVRAYAKLLRIDSAPLVAALSQEAGPQEEGIPLRRPISSTPFAPAKLAPMNRASGGKKLWGWIALAVVVLAVAGAWRAGLFDSALNGMVNRGEGAPTQASASASASPESASTPAAIGASAPEDKSAAASGASGASGAAPANASSPSAPGAEPAGAATAATAPAAATSATNAAAAINASPANNAAPAVTAPTPAAEPTQATAARALVIKAKEECWIDIRRGGKSVTRTLKPGAVETVEVGAGVTVVLGNALGVEVNLDGKPIDVRAKARNNVTRLDLKSS